MSSRQSVDLSSNIAVERDASVRRLLDILVAGACLLAIWPLLALIAALVALTSPGPVVYRAQRVGKDSRLFPLYKFRTMIVGADIAGPALTRAGDARITAVGRWLRKTKLDELPQLINVLRGDMSLVGPRPEDPRYVAIYTPAQRRVLSVRPGVTSPASVRFRHEAELLQGVDWETTYRQVILPEKLRIELDYLERRTFFSDLLVLWQTFMALFR